MIKQQPHFHKPDMIVLLFFGVGLAFLITLGIHFELIKSQEVSYTPAVVSSPSLSLNLTAPRLTDP